MRRGFTLVEMLIVVALTALLVAMTMPGLSRTRQAARAVECRSNLRQIALLHVDPNGDGRWGNSPYDIDTSIGEVFEQPGSETDNDDSRRVRRGQRDRFRGQHDWGPVGGNITFQEFMEESALDQPRYWLLVCPEGLQFQRNSFGMRWQVRETPLERFARSRDIIFGCSDYKVVDVARSFAYRHAGQASFLFGDLHVNGHGLEIFSDDEQALESRRDEAQPLPHR